MVTPGDQRGAPAAVSENGSTGPATRPSTLAKGQASGARASAQQRPPSSGLSRTAGRSGSGGFKAPRTKFATPVRKLALKRVRTCPTM